MIRTTTKIQIPLPLNQLLPVVGQKKKVRFFELPTSGGKVLCFVIESSEVQTVNWQAARALYEAGLREGREQRKLEEKGEACVALEALGYSHDQARSAIEEASESEPGAAYLVSKALEIIGGKTDA